MDCQVYGAEGVHTREWHRSGPEARQGYNDLPVLVLLATVVMK